MDVMGTCYRLVGDLLHSLASHCKPVMKAVDEESDEPQQGIQLDELAARALTAVFGMDCNGRIKKEKARWVVQKLGLMGEDDEGFGFEEEEELRAEEFVGQAAEEETDEQKRVELLRRAFMVFDKDGDGFIDSSEVKRVLECLGLDKGWGMGEFERMVEVADLNFDGKVDFAEFELMMSAK
ncbi:calmodulin-like protein 3 [Aristolochia californica]|uniref:calmodulin-like protein 3 n=1 Tax=Aristolochia californica TaxID=171875 RepID=UPI0035DC2269